MRTVVFPAFAVLLAVACGSAESQNEGPRAPGKDANLTSIEIAELEISGGKGVDRFTSCPPPGELGQDWIPPLPPWSPPARPVEPAPGEPIGMPPPAPDGRTPTEKAIFDTYPDFRRCYQRGLMHDPTQDGHAAIVLRIGPDGKVGVVESY